jgi:hypothetical protein
LRIFDLPRLSIVDDAGDAGADEVAFGLIGFGYTVHPKELVSSPPSSSASLLPLSLIDLV